MKTSDFDLLKEIKQYYINFNNPISGPFVATSDMQDELINELISTVDQRQFFFVQSINDASISRIHGLHKWMGYSESNFQLYEYLQSLNTSMIQELMFYSKIIVEMCSSGKFRGLGFNQGKYLTCHSMKAHDGSEYYVQRTSTPFQLTPEGQITQYLNLVKIVKPYSGEPFYMDVMDMPRENLKMVMRRAAEIRNRELFNDKYRAIIDLTNDRHQLSDEEIGAEIGISTDTVKKYKQRIKAKVEDAYGVSHRYFSDTVAYLNKGGLSH